MKRIFLDLTDCRTQAGINETLAAALGAPEWHGRNLDAWYDSIVSDDMNAVRSPYVLVITGHGSLSPSLAKYVQKLASLFDDARKEGKIDVYCILEHVN